MNGLVFCVKNGNTVANRFIWQIKPRAYLVMVAY